MPESQQPSASLSVGLALRVEGAAHSVEIVEQAVMAERHGWDGVCLSASSNSSSSVLLTATAVAAQTEKLRLGVELLPDATLHPLRLAEDLATLDVVSSGRLEWMAADSALSADADEARSVVSRAWRGEPFDHDGPRWSFPELVCVPSPNQSPHPPIWCPPRPGRFTEKGEGVGSWIRSAEDLAQRSGSVPIALRGAWVGDSDFDGASHDLVFGPHVRTPHDLGPMGQALREGVRVWVFLELEADHPLPAVGEVRDVIGQRLRASP